jgi:hypothetical protein
MEECYIIIEGCVYDGFGIEETVYLDPNEAIKDVLFRVNEVNILKEVAHRNKNTKYVKDKDSNNSLISYSDRSYFIAGVKRKLK